MIPGITTDIQLKMSTETSTHSKTPATTLRTNSVLSTKPTVVMMTLDLNALWLEHAQSQKHQRRSLYLRMLTAVNHNSRFNGKSLAILIKLTAFKLKEKRL
jgi:hypothetical protein